MIDVDRGTAESAWRDDPVLDALQPFVVNPTGDVVVVAPHPDDEVLGVGGILRSLHRGGRRIVVAALSDGEASHPGTNGITARELERRRPRESRAALDRLGLAGCEIVRFGVPDGAIASHLAAVAAGLEELVTPEATVLATWRGDGHPDHEAAGHATAQVCASRGARLVEYPVWMWNWAVPGDGRVPWTRARSSTLDTDARVAKAAAIAEFRSQVEPVGDGPNDGPVLPDAVLDHHRRGFEVVFT